MTSLLWTCNVIYWKLKNNYSIPNSEDLSITSIYSYKNGDILYVHSSHLEWVKSFFYRLLLF